MIRHVQPSAIGPTVQAKFIVHVVNGLNPTIAWHVAEYNFDAEPPVAELPAGGERPPPVPPAPAETQRIGTHLRQTSGEFVVGLRRPGLAFGRVPMRRWARGLRSRAARVPAWQYCRSAGW
ncbi:hypothetical protein [Flexivirga caeni]|uniref:Uncharacterized protein n=1 Tax=Flexivirga caeni TaxID=2294115 RepID=A0A3M9M6L3_9MICO|nr:hypothetical protein [Flexivirga caeni]RNI21126.1 hypothetical protein EFY87_12690 [Flexivirga caeni]